MVFKKSEPKYKRLSQVEGFDLFLQNGRKQFCACLESLLNIDQVRIQPQKINDIKAWLQIKEAKQIAVVPNKNDEICLFSQIVVDGELIAMFPYVLKGALVPYYSKLKSFLKKVSEAVSSIITNAFLQKFIGCELQFGENMAYIIISNCMSSAKYDGLKFAHLVAKIEQLSSSSFEGSHFSTGMLIYNGPCKYREHCISFKEERRLDEIEKREWFLANGRNSFYVFNPNSQCDKLYIPKPSKSEDFIERYFDDYYLSKTLVAPDFVLRTLGSNEISIFDACAKEFIKVENVWRYRHHKVFAQYLVTRLKLKYKVAYGVLYYVMRCSQKHVSSIIWIPNNQSEQDIQSLTMENRVKIWKEDLSILDESHRPIIDKVLASDGAIVLRKSGKIMYESVFADMSGKSLQKRRLSGSGETAGQLLASNGVAIKISQDGSIKIYSGNEKWVY